jgi:hypothetical protein
VNVKTPKDKKSISIDEKATIKEVNVFIYRQYFNVFLDISSQVVKNYFLFTSDIRIM